MSHARTQSRGHSLDTINIDRRFYFCYFPQARLSPLPREHGTFGIVVIPFVIDKSYPFQPHWRFVERLEFVSVLGTP